MGKLLKVLLEMEKALVAGIHMLDSATSAFSLITVAGGRAAASARSREANVHVAWNERVATGGNMWIVRERMRARL